MHTFLLLISVFLFVLYVTSLGDITNAFSGLKDFVYPLFLILVFANLKTSMRRFFEKFGIMTLMFVILIVFHFVYGGGNFEGFTVSVLVYLLCTTVWVNVFKMDLFAFLLLGIYLFSFVAYPKELIIGLLSDSSGTGWNLIFQNSNMASLFICCVFASVYLFIKKQKIKKLSFLFVIIGLIACQSRNAVLFFVLSVFFLYFKKYLLKYRVYFPVFILLFFVVVVYYMIVIEPYLMNISHFIMFGKSEGTTGRSMQVLYIVENFDINLWGYDKLINEASMDVLNYPVHNFYVTTLYAFGLSMFLFYMYFVYKIYFMLKVYESQVFLLCFHVYFFFEPSWAFCVQLNYLLPMLIIAGSYRYIKQDISAECLNIYRCN